MQNRFSYIVLVFFVVVLGYLNYEIFKPFLFPIAWGIVFSLLFYPVHVFLNRYIKWRSLVSLIVIIIIIFLMIAPFSYFSVMLVKEAKGLLKYAGPDKENLLHSVLEKEPIKTIVEKGLQILQINEEELSKNVSDIVANVSKELTGIVTKGISGVFAGVFDFVIMAICLFFFLRDGPAILAKIQEYLPFSDEQKERMSRQAKDIIVSTMYGGVIIALVQGSIGGLAFALLGISSPVMWGLAMAIASFLPLVGAFIIWMPAAVYLFFSGYTLKAFILLIVGFFGISMVDNFLRPLIVGSRTKMPFLPLFFTVLGGIKFFGLLGIIMGPLIFALFVSIFEIFRKVETET